MDFDKAVEQILQRDERYQRDAYLFVRDALDQTQKNVLRASKEAVAQAPGQDRHVSARELLEGIRDYALQVYGPMTLLVLNEWGIQRCEDFGEIVFNLIEASLFKKTEKDNREDFKGGYLFEEAFKKPFLPNPPAGGDRRQLSMPSSERQSQSVDPA